MGFFTAVKNFFGQKKDLDHTKTEISGHADPEREDNQSRPVLPETDEHGSDASHPATYQESEAAGGGVPSQTAETVPCSPDTDAGAHTDGAHAGSGSEAVSHISESSTRGYAASGRPAAPATTDELVVRLRMAAPRLSVWLAIALDNVEEVNELFWERLDFLLQALEAPPSEIAEFLADFKNWLVRMEYKYVEEFRSELQYRLALALDLEDEEDERNRLLVKLSQGLARTRHQFGQRLDALLAGHGQLDQAFWDELEELFIMADLGYETSVQMVERLQEKARSRKITDPAQARELLLEELNEIFKRQPRIRAVNSPEVVLLIGVNGAGKTTTIAKLAYRARLQGKKALIVAADTFRAAAIDQLQVWANRVGAEFYSKSAGSDPASVAFEAMDYAKKNKIDIVFVDTAGRLQTKINLMEELAKIRQVLAKKHPGAPHRSILVLDATTGQNALSQVKLFKDSAGADELILTKLDGTAKGGVAIAVAMQEKLPISYIGLGEKMEDLRPFNGADFARALLGEESAAAG